jgi:HEAT repeat protein
MTRSHWIQKAVSLIIAGFCALTGAVSPALAQDEPAPQADVVEAEAIAEAPTIHDIFELLDRKVIATRCRGAGIEKMSIHVTWNDPPQAEDGKTPRLHVRLPVGTVFEYIPDKGRKNVQNMLATSSHMFVVSAGREITTEAPVACMNRERRIPHENNRFLMRRPANSATARLARHVQKLRDTARQDGERLPKNFDRAVQAATWIITDDATFEQLGILRVSSGFVPVIPGQAPGRRAIGIEEALTAMKLCEDAGVALDSRRIWQDRWLLTHGLGLEQFGLGEWCVRKLQRNCGYTSKEFPQLVGEVLRRAKTPREAGRAIELASELKLTDRWTDLLRLAEQERSAVQAGQPSPAYRAAAQLGGPKAINAFANIARSNEAANHRQAACMVLGGLYESAETDAQRQMITAALQAALRDENRGVKQQAVTSLTRQDSLANARILAGLLDDEEIGRQAARALCEFSAPGVAALLLPVARMDNGRRAHEVVQALRRCPPDEALPVLDKLAIVSDARTRQWIASALGDMQTAESVETLIAMLGDDDASVRYAAATAMGPLPPDVCVPQLTKALGGLSDDARKTAIDVLAEKADPRAALPLLAIVEGDDEDLARRAVRALAAVRAVTAIPVLRRRLQTASSENLRNELAQVIKRLQDVPPLSDRVGAIKERTTVEELKTNLREISNSAARYRINCMIVDLTLAAQADAAKSASD